MPQQRKITARKTRAKERWQELLSNLEKWVALSGKLKRSTPTDSRTIYKVRVTGRSGGCLLTIILHADMKRDKMTVEIRCSNEDIREDIADGLDRFWTSPEEIEEEGNSLTLLYDRIPFNTSR